MTLNFSHRPSFHANPSEDNYVSSIRIANGCTAEVIQDKNGDSLGKPRCSNWEIEDSYDYSRDRAADKGVSNDILDLLPSDPFGMNITATFTAITGWLGDLEADSEGFVRDEAGVKKRDYQLVAGLNFIWNKAMRFQAEPGDMGVVDKSNPAGRFNGCVEEQELGNGLHDGGFVSVCNVKEFESFGDEDTLVAGSLTKEFWGGTGSYSDGDRGSAGSRTMELWEGTGSCSNGEGGAPHEAFLFALGYLGVQDLLSVERVCRSLCSAVQSDLLLWKSIIIEQPLSERITDDALLHLTSRAQGSLQCLSLVECPRITDDGLKRVLESNPRLTKLCVPGCPRLSVEGIMNNLKAFNSSGIPGIKHLRIGGLYGVTSKHYEELKFLLAADNNMRLNAHKPRFYHNGHLHLSCDDDRAIDIEICPRCQNLRLVYDCPAESCQGKQHATQLCRACTLCIARCVQCGQCINDSEYEETFCLDLLCLGCLKQLLKCQERQDEKGAPSKHAIFHQETRHQFHRYG
ncbi:hypothetical protein HHK36_025117 [Tetracentron sinense]|uniref:F-box domain-containing protein n=1 Tax=Tetracentron sinense TaxID=13715 RepID=A0A834YM31_TETSI|nr:hypothetical protein HHK36_025117 [Tetracentron sinense]